MRSDPTEEHITIEELEAALRKSGKLNLRGKNLSRIDFRYLTTTDLSGADLSGANLSGSVLDGFTLKDTNLFGANLSDASMRKADLSRAILQEAKLSSADVQDATLTDADLSDADLSSAKLNNAVMHNVKLCRADLSSANPAILCKADLTGADLHDAILSSADLSEATLIGVDLSRANLSRAKLSQAIVSNAKLFEANLSQANLREADLRRSNLKQAILSKADLKDAKLEGVELSREALGDIYLELTTFNKINLNGQDKNREDAINEAKAAKTYLSDIQQVADAFSNRINQYNDNVLRQSQRSFNIALWLAAIGTAFFLLIIGIVFYLVISKVQNSSIIGILGGVAGTLIEIISGIIFVLYARTSSQFKTFHVSLHRTQLFLLANSICENLDGKEKHLARKGLVEIMANTSATLGEEEPKTKSNQNSKVSAKTSKKQQHIIQDEPDK